MISRSRSLTGSLAATLLALGASAASAGPVTQACLGSLDKFLTCPANSHRVGTECRASGGEWAGISREGPSLVLRDPEAADPKVRLAATYKDDAKTGRVFRFDAEGRLE